MSKASGYGVLRLQISGEERQDYGCIVNFSDGDCRWFPGRDGAREAAEYADRSDLKITTISTPETIYRDLQGPRSTQDPGASWKKRDAIYFPESNILGLIGRRDLLARQPRDPRKR